MFRIFFPLEHLLYLFHRARETTLNRELHKPNLSNLMRNTGVKSSLPWNKVSPSKCTMPYFLPLWSKPTTCAMYLYLEGKLMKKNIRISPTTTYISRNLVVEAKQVLEKNACDISIKVSYNCCIFRLKLTMCRSDL